MRPLRADDLTVNLFGRFWECRHLVTADRLAEANTLRWQQASPGRHQSPTITCVIRACPLSSTAVAERFQSGVLFRLGTCRGDSGDDVNISASKPVPVPARSYRFPGPPNLAVAAEWLGHQPARQIWCQVLRDESDLWEDRSR
jgi:hypothetical protein